MAQTDKEIEQQVERERTERYVDGLTAELEGARRSGDADLEQQIVAELRRVGGKAPQGRSAGKKETAAPDAAGGDGK